MEYTQLTQKMVGKEKEGNKGEGGKINSRLPVASEAKHSYVSPRVRSRWYQCTERFQIYPKA